MIRLSLLFLVIAFLAVYAWKDWYRSLCGLILLVAVGEHPDMPKSLLGVPGLNPWNLLFLVVLLAWLFQRRREGLRWDLSAGLNLLLLFYLGVMIASFARMMADRDALPYDAGYLVRERMINVVKWTIPGLMLYDGARSRQRFVLGLASLLGIYLLLGVQVIKWMPLSEIASGDLAGRSLKILLNEIGYHRVNLSAMLAGASWAIFSARELAPGRLRRALVVLLGATVLFAQALTGGRMGYAAWAAVGLSLCLLRWRGYLLLAPVAVALVVLLVPSVTERALEGIGVDSGSTYDADGDGVDEYAVTAGRTLIWPYVVAKIDEAPVFGHGGLAMQRTGLSTFLYRELGEAFGHPHNAYLEMLLDNGWVGLLLVLPFYLVVLARSVTLFLDSRSPVFVAAGGAAAALLLALLFASLGSQTFYPREGAVGMWCAIGLALRVWQERRGAQAEALAEARVERERRAAAALREGVRGLWLPTAPRAVPLPGSASLDPWLWARAR